MPPSNPPKSVVPDHQGNDDCQRMQPDASAHDSWRDEQAVGGLNATEDHHYKQRMHPVAKLDQGNYESSKTGEDRPDKWDHREQQSRSHQ